VQERMLPCPIQLPLHMNSAVCLKMWFKYLLGLHLISNLEPTPSAFAHGVSNQKIPNAPTTREFLGMSQHFLVALKHKQEVTGNTHPFWFLPTYVLKWKSKDTKYVNKPNANDLAKLQQTHAFFWQFFVPGAPAYLNNNVNPDIALVNGSPLITHSLTFEQRSHYQKIIDHINTMRLHGTPVPYGSEILVPQPLAVNVIVQETLDGKSISKKRTQQLDKLRVISRSYNIDPKNRAIIIPLTTAMAKSTGESSSKCFTFCTKNMLSPIAKVHAQEPFPFDLAFAMTVHKAQGRTINRVVVDLTHHPRHCCCMKHAAIFVAMSRVAETDHIRLLEPNTIYQRESLCTYLSSI